MRIMEDHMQKQIPYPPLHETFMALRSGIIWNASETTLIPYRNNVATVNRATIVTDNLDQPIGIRLLGFPVYPMYIPNLGTTIIMKTRYMDLMYHTIIDNPLATHATVRPTTNININRHPAPHRIMTMIGEGTTIISCDTLGLVKREMH